MSDLKEKKSYINKMINCNLLTSPKSMNNKQITNFITNTINCELLTKYNGSMKKGKPDGPGIAEYNNGILYGEFVNGILKTGYIQYDDREEYYSISLDKKYFSDNIYIKKKNNGEIYFQIEYYDNNSEITYIIRLYTDNTTLNINGYGYFDCKDNPIKIDIHYDKKWYLLNYQNIYNYEDYICFGEKSDNNTLEYLGITNHQLLNIYIPEIHNFDMYEMFSECFQLKTDHKK